MSRLGVVRSLVERVSRGVVLRRRLPVRFGGAAMHVSPDSALKFWWGSLARVEANLLSWVDELVRPGDVVWDLGANVGVFGLASAWRAGVAGEVLLVEPDPWLVGLLRLSVARLPSRAAPTAVVPLAIADQPGRARFQIAARGRASNHLARLPGQGQDGGVREEIEVEVQTLDGLRTGRRAPTLIKIDVEGAEAAVLDGGRGLLARDRPTLLCEVGARNAEVVGRQLHELGYALFDADLPAPERVPMRLPSFNALARPRDT